MQTFKDIGKIKNKDEMKNNLIKDLTKQISVNKFMRTLLMILIQ